MTLFVHCRPETSPPATGESINVEDTDDEFEIKKPTAKDPKYDDFIDELYRHDEAKKPKSKRDADQDGLGKLTIETPAEYEIPAKPSSSADGNYDEFLNHLYRHDELKRIERAVRAKRMIIFRHEHFKKRRSVD